VLLPKSSCLGRYFHVQATLCVGDACLEHGWGVMWSSGDRVSNVWVPFFSNIQQMTEREIFDVPHDAVLGEEYRGVRTDGSLFRWAGVFNESVGYDNTSSTAAAVFDKVIDSLCWG
jgi:hypothetical protein